VRSAVDDPPSHGSGESGRVVRTQHDPFVPLLITTHIVEIDLGSSVIVREEGRAPRGTSGAGRGHRRDKVGVA